MFYLHFWLLWSIFSFISIQICKSASLLPYTIHITGRCMWRYALFRVWLPRYRLYQCLSHCKVSNRVYCPLSYVFSVWKHGSENTLPYYCMWITNMVICTRHPRNPNSFTDTVFIYFIYLYIYYFTHSITQNIKKLPEKRIVSNHWFIWHIFGIQTFMWKIKIKT